MRMRSTVPAEIEANYLIIWDHNTTNVLSEKVPICSSCNGRCVISSSRQFRRRPANSRSLVLMFPSGFESLIRVS